jgi:tRNA dimethylallyltransferase
MKSLWPKGRIVFLMGPTGSGKSSLAIRLSELLPIEIISVDSTLVYRGAKIGAARPSSSMLCRVPHHLIGICSPESFYSVAKFQEDASRVIAKIQVRGKLPVLVGGTGMYFRALENGLHDLPDRDEGVRKELETLSETYGSLHLHEMLAGLDPESARRIHKNDSHRLIRAIEVFRVTGDTMTSLLAKADEKTSVISPIKFVLSNRNREALALAIAKRFDDMLERGLVNEVNALLKNTSIAADNSLLGSVGYKQVCDYLAGKIHYMEMKRQAVVATCQLAKRQRTWLRKEIDAIWCDSESVKSDVGTMVQLICGDIGCR